MDQSVCLHTVDPQMKNLQRQNKEKHRFINFWWYIINYGIMFCLTCINKCGAFFWIKRMVTSPYCLPYWQLLLIFSVCSVGPLAFTLICYTWLLWCKNDPELNRILATLFHPGHHNKQFKTVNTREIQLVWHKQGQTIRLLTLNVSLTLLVCDECGNQ